jgi:hypothetical protein
VVDSLARRTLIEPQSTQREGRRPERTVYALTDAGRIALEEWLNQALSIPVKEYTTFEAALSLLPILPPGEVIELLETRRQRLELEVGQLRATGAVAAREGIPRLFSIENEYWLALREAELAWVTATLSEFKDGSFDGLDQWHSFHADERRPAGEREEVQAENE